MDILATDVGCKPSIGESFVLTWSYTLAFLFYYNTCRPLPVDVGVCARGCLRNIEEKPFTHFLNWYWGWIRDCLEKSSSAAYTFPFKQFGLRDMCSRQSFLFAAGLNLSTSYLLRGLVAIFSLPWGSLSGFLLLLSFSRCDQANLISFIQLYVRFRNTSRCLVAPRRHQYHRKRYLIYTVYRSDIMCTFSNCVGKTKWN